MDYRQNDPIDRVTRLIDEYGVRVHGVCPEQCNPKPHNMAAKDAGIQERTLAYFSRAVDVAKSIGARQVLVTSGWAYYNEPVEVARERSAAMLKQVARYAGEQGIDLAIEGRCARPSRASPTPSPISICCFPWSMSPP